MGDAFTLGVAVGLGDKLPRLGRAYALNEKQAEKVRARIREHVQTRTQGAAAGV